MRGSVPEDLEIEARADEAGTASTTPEEDV